jgi:GNAT superfamily N-acetyltransferase
VTIRAASPADAGAVHALACGFDGRPVTEPGEAFLARYDRLVRSDDHALLVADDLSGYALAQDYGTGLRRAFSTGRLHDLYVDPAARRRGTGRALVAAVEAWCRAQPHPMVLDWQSRLDAVAFYESLGYVADRVGDTAEHPAFCLDLR